MNNTNVIENKKITIVFSNSQKAEFEVHGFDEEELKKIISQFNNGNLMKFRNLFVNPKNINCFKVDDLYED